MTNGAVIFAQNSANLDYIKMAVFSAMKLKENLDIPVSLITDSAGWLEKCYPDHVFDNVLNIYLAEQGVLVENPYVELSRDNINQWAAEEFLPSVVTNLQLNPKKIHYLDRMADYVNRGEHLLSDYICGNKHRSNEKYVELIVRYMEFKAAGLGVELTEPFQGLGYFHIEHASPVMCAVIQNSTVASLPFDLGMVGEDYVCLTN